MEIKKDIREEITNKFIEALEKNLKPWKSNVLFKQPQNATTKQFYTGINRVYLNLVSLVSEYKSNKWLSFNQAKSLGGNVKKGEKGTHIVFYKTFDNEEIESDDSADLKKGKKIAIMKHYSIFNLDQCENILIKEEQEEPQTEDNIEGFIEKLNLNLDYKNCRNASYNQANDKISMPLKFTNTSAKYATLFHEISHWTGHELRLNRLKKFDKYGSDSYAFEELVAEISAAFLCSHFQINSEAENHASYVKYWLDILKRDKKAIFEAAAKAQEAFNYVLNKAENFENKMIA